MSQIKNRFLAQVPANTLKGNNTGSTANPTDLTVSQVQTMLSVPTASSPLAATAGGTGLTSVGTSGNVLTSNGTTWVSQAPTGGGGATLNYWCGTLTNNTSNGFYTSSTTLTSALGQGGTPTFTTRSSSGITVAQSASMDAGITFTPAASTSVYIVSAVFAVHMNANSIASNLVLKDSSGVVISQSSFNTNSSIQVHPVCLSGIYVPGTSSAITIYIYMLNEAGNTSYIAPADPSLGQPHIEWTVTQIR